MKHQYYQNGMSLLELMVSLSIGILLLLGLAGFYQTAINASKENDILSMNAESARQVFNRLEYDLKHAGYVDLYDKPKSLFTDSKTAINEDCPDGAFVSINPKYETHLKDKPYSAGIANIRDDANNRLLGTVYLRRQLASSSAPAGTLTNLNKNYLNPLGYLSCGTMRPVYGCEFPMTEKPDINIRSACATSGDSNSIEITYQAIKASASNVSSLESKAYDCTYQDISKNNNALEKTNGFIINRYFLKQDPSNGNDRSLYCQGNASKVAKPLVPGIQEMNFRYITTVPETDANKTLGDSDTGKVVTSYKTATEVENDPLGWSGVVGVEVCIIVGTPSNGSQLANAQGQTRATCAREANGQFANNVSKEDNKRFYDRYVRTFSMPNSLYSPLN